MASSSASSRVTVLKAGTGDKKVFSLLPTHNWDDFIKGIETLVGPVGQVRCPKSGAIIENVQDIVQGEDSVLVIPTEQMNAWTIPTNYFMAGSSADADNAEEDPRISLVDANEAQALGRVDMNSFVSIGGNVAALQKDAGTGALVLPVVFRGMGSSSSSSYIASMIGRRFSLHVIRGNDTPKCAALAHAWDMYATALPPHPNILRVLTRFQQVTLPSELAALVSRTGGLGTTNGGSDGAAAVDALLTEPCMSVAAASVLASRPLPFPVAFGYALDLTRSLAHLAEFHVYHGDIRPAHLHIALSSVAATQQQNGSNTGGGVEAPGRLLLGGFTKGIAFQTTHNNNNNNSNKNNNISATTSTREQLQQQQQLNNSMVISYRAFSASAAGKVPADAACYLAPEVAVAVRAATTSPSNNNNNNTSMNTTNSGKSDGGGWIPLGKADTWAAGVTLYELFTGNFPFPGYPSSFVTAASSSSTSGSSSSSSSWSCDAFTSLYSSAAPSFPSDYPPAFCDLLVWMLRPDPSQRITARGAARRLLGLGTGHPTAPLPIFVSKSVPPSGAVPGAVGIVQSGENSPSSSSSSSSAVAMVEDGKDGTADDNKKVKQEDDEDIGVMRYIYIKPSPDALQLRSSSSSSAGDRIKTNKTSIINVGLVPYAATDAETVAIVAARASEILDVTGNSKPTSLSLVNHQGRRIDPLVPMHRLPVALRKAVLGLAPGLSAVPPDIIVHGYGIAAPPPPPFLTPAQRQAILASGQAGGAGMTMPYHHHPPSSSSSSSAMGAGFGAPPGISSTLPPPALLPSTSTIPGALALPSNSNTATTTTTGNGAGGGVSGAATGAGGNIPPVIMDANATIICNFDTANHHPNIILSERGTVVTSTGTWGSAFLEQGKVSAAAGRITRYSYSVQILACEPGAGIVIGFADPERFQVANSQFGSTIGSWGYSRTGQISNGTGDALAWVDYGEPFTVGDVITAEVVLAREPRMRFWKNGVPQGLAFKGTELSKVFASAAAARLNKVEESHDFDLVPCVCMGSTTGFRTTRLQLKNPEVREFDRQRAHSRIQFSEDCATVFNAGKWATALAAHPGVRTGKLVWSVRLDDTRHGAGVAIGVVNADQFAWDKQNLGASSHSWCYSKTGKKGDGTGFAEYGKQFTNGDTITLSLDMDVGTLSFSINGDDQGIAYDASSGIRDCTLIPAVCLGSTEGNKMAKVSILGPYTTASRFNRFACNRKIALSEMFSAAETNDKWGTVFLEHPGIRNGRYSFAVLITSAGQGCGAGVGFADADSFNPENRNLGAAPGSWCYSKTGKYSGGVGFEAYGTTYRTGDVITAEVDMDSETFRFYLNGKDQGPKKAEGIKLLTLVPAIVLGSSDGGHYTKLNLTASAVTRFDGRRMNRHVVLRDEDRVAFTDSRWCSVLVDHAGVSTGVLRFAVKLDGDGGAAIGFAEGGSFKPYAQNLGASPGTWAISKTGKVSCGDAEGFHPFSEKFGKDDVIGAEADMTEGIVRFWKNGNLLGTAFQGLAGRNLCLVPSVCLGSNTGSKESSAALVEFDVAWLR